LKQVIVKRFRDSLFPILNSQLFDRHVVIGVDADVAGDVQCLFDDRARI